MDYYLINKKLWKHPDLKGKGRWLKECLNQIIKDITQTILNSDKDY